MIREIHKLFIKIKYNWMYRRKSRKKVFEHIYDQNKWGGGKRKVLLWDWIA